MTALLHLFLLTCAQYALAERNSSEVEYSNDPFLALRPEFARSLPIQILLTGIVLTLVAVLFIHLLFTAQYHWPLAPINYVLQMAGVTTLLISLIATLHVVLSTTIAESRRWPYMLSYIAVNVPPSEDGLFDEDSDSTSHHHSHSRLDGSSGWNMAEKATWMVMTATTSILIQITHIHFLTLLFPSRLEARLIIFLLGPLALIAAVVQLLPIANNEDVTYVASAIKNVCNATLSMLFTAALFIWGVLINRKTAWRTDGGTAVFGVAALSLALVSTALNLLYIYRREEFLWMPSLIWAVILWQSFLGWWWWVGAGSGTSADDRGSVLEREERNERKRREARMKRKNTKERAKTAIRAATSAIASPLSLRRRQTVAAPNINDDAPQLTEEVVVAIDQSSSSSRTQQVEETTTSETGSSLSTLPSFLPAVVHRWYASLRTAHVTAARQQAQERAERLREMEREGESAHNSPGWGLGSYGLRVGASEGERSRSRSRGRREGSISSVERDSSEDEQDPPIEETRRSITRDRPRSLSLPPEEVEMSNLSSDGRASGVEPEPAAGHTGLAGGSRSPFWWGPLGKWRLRDSTTY